MPADIRDPSLTLSQATRVYTEHATSRLLQRHFVCGWFHRVPPDRHAPALVVPDGHADLFWSNGALRISGTDRQARFEPLSPGSTIVGLRFRPGAAREWLRVPMSELVGARVPLESFWGTEARRISDWISEGGTPEGIARRLESALARKASRLDSPDELSHSIVRLIEESRHTGVNVVQHLREELALNERTLRRRCHDIFGYGPKTLDRILRFQRFLQVARARDAVGMAAVAAEAGYADQPHLIRETRQLAGMTPGAVLAELG